MTALVIVVLAFLATEPLAALLHRRIMHRPRERWHRSHHLPPTDRPVEPNDRYPLIIAVATIIVFAIATRVDALRPVIWIATGVTLWGLGYLVVHDVCVHGRGLGRPVGTRGYVAYVRRAHRAHHVTTAAPYGFLLPVVGRRARARVLAVEARPDARRDPSGRPVAAAAATRSLRAVGTDARCEKTS